MLLHPPRPWFGGGNSRTSHDRGTRCGDGRPCKTAKGEGQASPPQPKPPRAGRGDGIGNTPSIGQRFSGRWIDPSAGRGSAARVHRVLGRRPNLAEGVPDASDSRMLETEAEILQASWLDMLPRISSCPISPNMMRTTNPGRGAKEGRRRTRPSTLAKVAEVRIWRGDVERPIRFRVHHQVMNGMDVIVHRNPRQALPAAADWSACTLFAGKSCLPSRASCGRGDQTCSKMNQARPAFGGKRCVFPCVGHVAQEPFSSAGRFGQHLVTTVSIHANGRA